MNPFDDADGGQPGLKESVDTNVPRRKPDINQEWEKEYQIASQQDHQEEIADVEAEEE